MASKSTFIRHTPHGFSKSLAAAAAWGVAGVAAALPCAPQWEAVGSGLAALTYALKVYDDGTGPALYAAGQFTSAGGGPANRVARWDGQAWSALGTGVNNTVISLAVFDDGGGDALYAGGVFLMAGGAPAVRIAKWDGQAWSPLGSGATSNVQALTVYDDGAGEALYAGGVFLSAGGLEVNRIAKWDGQAWSALGTGVDGTIQRLTTFDDGTGNALYAAGFFESAGGVPGTAYLARWNGQAWSAVGTGVDGVVRAIGVHDDGSGPALYAAIDWYAIPTGVPTSRVARWDGQTWTEVGTPTNGSLVEFFVFDEGTGAGDALYAVGTFTSISGTSAARIARWDGASWSPLGSGITGGGNVVHALASFDHGAGPMLYAAGGFTTAGPVAATRIARWHGCTPPTPCYPDCDGDESLSLADFGCFQTKFALADPYADCNGDSLLNLADFGCFQTTFALGCP